MPPEAIVAIFEDNPSFLEEYRWYMKDGGHSVVGVATNMSEAVGLVPRLDELGVEVVLLDGNLSPDMDDGSEGRLLARGIKSRNPDIKIVGVSMAGTVEGADFNVSKTRMLVDRVDLGEFVGGI